MPDALLAITHALLEGVDTLPPRAGGAFVVTRSGVDRGMVVAEHNRVCWATAVGLERRLRQLLAEHVGRRLDRNALVATPGVDRALREHSVESLTALCGEDDGVIRWIPRDRPLGAAWTFAPAALLAAVGARLYAAEAASAHGALPADCAGGSFAVDDDGDAVLVDEHAGERLGIAALAGLGRWAAAALDAAPGFSAAMIERTLAGAKQPIALGWRTGRRVIHARLFDERAERAAVDRAIAALRERRAPIVVSACVPWKLRESIVRDGPDAIVDA